MSQSIKVGSKFEDQPVSATKSERAGSIHFCTHTYCSIDSTFIALCRVRLGKMRLF